jgi:hypothetical protein
VQRCNKNLNNWNVSNVTEMKCMFWNSLNFNQNISCWNISKNTEIHNMFCFNSKIKFYKLNTSSFFDKEYKNMDIDKRKLIFNTLFDSS